MYFSVSCVLGLFLALSQIHVMWPFMQSFTTLALKCGCGQIFKEIIFPKLTKSGRPKGGKLRGVAQIFLKSASQKIK